MAVYINIGQADKSIRIHYVALRRITVKGFCSTVNDSQVRSALAECGTFSVSGVQNRFTDTQAFRCYLKKLILVDEIKWPASRPRILAEQALVHHQHMKNEYW